jgi:polyribonucleotide nucleotidyltransferase
MNEILHKVSKTIGGREITLETGRIARQAKGAVFARMGETVVFTAVTSAPFEEEQDFFPLTVDYREKTSAAGKFPGGFMKREGRPSLEEILVARLIDRPIRPLFPEGFSEEVSVASMVFAFDLENSPDLMAVISASACIHISDLPFMGPIAAVRMGYIDGKLVVNPTLAQRETSLLDLIVAGTKDVVTMLEGSAKEVEEKVVLEAVAEAHKHIKELCGLQEELRAKCGLPKMEVKAENPLAEVFPKIKSKLGAACMEKMRTPGKFERKEAQEAVIKEYIEKNHPEPSEDDLLGRKHWHEAVKKVKASWEQLKHETRRALILTGTREDGRSSTDIRQITSEVGLLPRNHGSALFTRGETQALVSVTLGTGLDEQRIDGLLPEYTKKFLLHYNFQAYSVGETWPNRGPKRREFGHGALAERALLAVLPAEENFPYTIRIVSDIMESNGSSSMATVCGGTLAMMDAGVPIIRPVAGIAMGLVTDGGKAVVLSDIVGGEDHDGDMDMKIAGTEQGLTAVQLDVKISGLSMELLGKALEQAKNGRLEILRKMTESCGLLQPREKISDYAPRLIRIQIAVDKIGKLIGPGGKMIRKIQEDTESTIEVDDDGTVVISAVGAGKAEVARDIIQNMLTDVEIGQCFTGKVVSVRDFGCFIELPNQQEGMCHVSELDSGFVKDINDVVKVGDTLDVKVINVDATGRIKLSRKQALQDKGLLPPDDPNRPQRPERSERPREHGRSGHGRPRSSGGDRDRGPDRPERGSYDNHNSY